jgi:hypothetical protein
LPHLSVELGKFTICESQKNPKCGFPVMPQRRARPNGGARMGNGMQMKADQSKRANK